MTSYGKYLTILLVLLFLPAMALSQPGAYEDAFNVSYDLEAKGQFGQAAETLEKLAEAYAQDFALLLRLGWLHFKDGALESSRRHYLAALKLNGDSQQAMLGLGWALFYLGEKGKARTAFERVLQGSPSEPSAKEGLSLSQPGHSLEVLLSAVLQRYPAHPTKESASGFSVRIPARLFDHYLIGGAYRYGTFNLRSGNGFVAAWDDDGQFQQHEGYFYGGLSYLRWGLSAAYAHLSNDAQGEESVNVVGVTGRFSPWGHVLLSGNASLYDSDTVVRTQVAWSMPVLSWLSVKPGAAYQYGNDESFWNLFASATARWGRVTLAAGGKFGDEYRPAYLDSQVVYNLPDTIGWGAWTSLGVALKGGWTLAGLYEFQQLTSKSTDDSLQSGMHVFMATVGWQMIGGEDGTK
jgi:tetratricopeptide (TPR) repeat protein